MSFSNTPISRRVLPGYDVDDYFDGIAWSNTRGLFFTGEPEPMPIREPYPALRRPTEGRKRRR